MPCCPTSTSTSTSKSFVKLPTVLTGSIVLHLAWVLAASSTSSSLGLASPRIYPASIIHVSQVAGRKTQVAKSQVAGVKVWAAWLHGCMAA
ncbi:hypothetical protein K504DRAFT_501941 [Pleomassaria siparia CBS 279.74]|uniref:Uncharacterized protein n=1 Tax=Pleomassaria siparia CBS 279.74 TaxID=1314801 RepID=A0A6G1K9T9_9PLEO|nr:hypothetical protein K504DRAFT_501941 [Pleomassaria siparia CBS 279.74]